jgi:hypothetical protein
MFPNLNPTSLPSQPTPRYVAELDRFRGSPEPSEEKTRVKREAEGENIIDTPPELR